MVQSLLEIDQTRDWKPLVFSMRPLMVKHRSPKPITGVRFSPDAHIVVSSLIPERGKWK